MSRLFDGTDDQMVYTVPGSGLNVNAAHTILIVARIMATADNTWLSLIETETSGAANSAALIRQQLSSTTGSVGWAANGSLLGNGGSAITDSDGWMVIAATKAGGSSTPRLHSTLLSGPTHRHNDAGTSMGAANSIASGVIRIGGNDDFANIRVAAAAIFTKVLSDAEIEGIAVAKTTQSIYDLTPAWLVDDADWSVDLMGNANRTSLTGTADDGDDPAGWAYGISGGSDPVNTVAPAATPTPVTEGNVVTCTTGTWTGTPTPTYTYQWHEGITSGYPTFADPISGATASTYTPPSVPVGGGIYCVVTATNTGDAVEALSNDVTVEAAGGGADPTCYRMTAGGMVASVARRMTASGLFPAA